MLYLAIALQKTQIPRVFLGRTDFRRKIAEIWKFLCLYDGHTEFILKKTHKNGRTDSSSKKNTDGRKLKNGRLWPSLLHCGVAFPLIRFLSVFGAVLAELDAMSTLFGGAKNEGA